MKLFEKQRIFNYKAWKLTKAAYKAAKKHSKTNCLASESIYTSNLSIVCLCCLSGPQFHLTIYFASADLTQGSLEGYAVLYTSAPSSYPGINYYFSV